MTSKSSYPVKQTVLLNILALLLIAYPFVLLALLKFGPADFVDRLEVLPIWQQIVLLAAPVFLMPVLLYFKLGIRLRRREFDDAASVLDERALEVDTSEFRSTFIRRIYYAGVLTVALFLGIVIFLWSTNPDIPLGFAAAIFGGMGLLVVVLWPILTLNARRVLSLTEDAKQIFLVNQEKILVPALLLNEGAWYYLHQANIPVLKIPWQEVVQVHVLPTEHGAHGCFVLEVTGATAEFAPALSRFRLNTTHLILIIKREPLKRIESSFVALAISVLGESRVLIQDDLRGAP